MLLLLLLLFLRFDMIPLPAFNVLVLLGGALNFVDEEDEEPCIARLVLCCFRSRRYL